MSFRFRGNGPAYAFAGVIGLLSLAIVISTSQEPQAWALGKEFWSAIAGATLGGLIAFTVQMVSLSESRQARAADRKQVRETLGTSLFLKSLRIYSNLAHIHNHFEESFSSKAASLMRGEPWTFVYPLVNPPTSVHFSSDELALLLSLKDNDVFNSVVDLDEIHNGLIQVVTAMSAKRAALLEKLPPGQGIGPAFSISLGPEERSKLQPWIFEVNDLIHQARARAKFDAQAAEQAIEGLKRVLRERLGLPYSTEKKAIAALPVVTQQQSFANVWTASAKG